MSTPLEIKLLKADKHSSAKGYELIIENVEFSAISRHGESTIVVY